MAINKLTKKAPKVLNQFESRLTPFIYKLFTAQCYREGVGFTANPEAAEEVITRWIAKWEKKEAEENEFLAEIAEEESKKSQEAITAIEVVKALNLQGTSEEIAWAVYIAENRIGQAQSFLKDEQVFIDGGMNFRLASTWIKNFGGHHYMSVK